MRVGESRHTKPQRSARATEGAAYSGGVEPGSTAAPPRITLIAKHGCHLCDEARAVIQRVASDVGVGWDERSIEEDPALAERYWEQIPVTLVDGRQHDYWRVDERRLRAALGA